jgi:hypothetical protein
VLCLSSDSIGATWDLDKRALGKSQRVELDSASKGHCHSMEREGTYMYYIFRISESLIDLNSVRFHQRIIWLQLTLTFDRSLFLSSSCNSQNVHSLSSVPADEVAD